MQDIVLGEGGVPIREVSSFQGLNCMQEIVLGEGGVLIREVSSFPSTVYIIVCHQRTGACV